jgi:hypothetical protein
MSEMTRRFWHTYQKTGSYDDMVRWLKHRAFVKCSSCEHVELVTHLDIGGRKGSGKGSWKKRGSAMTPEELEAMRKWPLSKIDPIPRLFAHIDYQAAQIATLKAALAMCDTTRMHCRGARGALEKIKEEKG